MVRESVPEGYKETEVGVIPEDWEVKRLGEILDNARLGGNYPNSELETKHPLIKMGNIDRGSIDTSKVEYVAEGYIPADKDKLHYGDVLFNTRNTLELVGKVAIWRNELPCAYYNSNLLRLGFKPCYVGSNFFINYVFNTKNLLSQLKGFATGTTSVAAIYSRDLYEVKIPLPPLPEQKAIARVLSDIDELITSMEKLIDKKEKIKQGTMQLLLTGKKRLPGFTGEWEVKRLGEVARIVNGGTPRTANSSYWNGNIKWCTPTDITKCKSKYLKNTEKKITRKGLDNSSATLLPRGALLLCSRATIGEVRIAYDKISTNQGFKSLICENNVYNEYLYYHINQLKDKLIEKASGSTFLEISKKDIARIEIILPPLPEQQAIAQILSDMDAEIESLQKKRDKYKLIKEGMMDKLLTGKVRLI